MPSLASYQKIADEMINTYLNTEEDKKLLVPLAKHYSTVYSREYTNPRFKLTIAPDSYYSYKSENEGDMCSTRFMLALVADCNGQAVGMKNGQARFTLSMYPYCCAMLQLNGFDHANTVTEDQIDRFMRLCFRVYRLVNNNPYHRVIMNMVEISRYAGGAAIRENLTEDIPQFEEAEIQYDHFYKWAKKQERVQDTLMRNPNTGHIIHHMEVIVNPSV